MSRHWNPSSRREDEMTNEELKAYRDAWNKLQETVLDEKTGWGKEELKKRMDKLLIECMRALLK
jgi:hypothetical protein